VYHPGAVCGFIFFHGGQNINSKQHISGFGSGLHRTNRQAPIDFSSILRNFLDEVSSVISLLNKELLTHDGFLKRMASEKQA
jgi:hypothetical protein